jgi:hypothetical protein
MFEKAKPLELYLVRLINLVKEIDLISLNNLTVVYYNADDRYCKDISFDDDPKYHISILVVFCIWLLDQLIEHIDNHQVQLLDQ